MSMLQHALSLAERGIAIIPLHVYGKISRIGGWQRNASTDPVQIRRWWGCWPDSNIGIHCGLSGLVVVDLDMHGGRNGEKTLRSICRDIGESFPEALSVLTPTGGKHLYFRAPSGIAMSNTAGRIGEGIDSRAGNGFVVAPPSMTYDGRYVWVKAPLLVLPEWLTERLRKPVIRYRDSADGLSSDRVIEDGYIAEAISREVATIEECVEGRNNALNRAAYVLGQLVGSSWANLDRQYVADQLLAAAFQCGIGEHEAVKTIESGLRSGEAQPRPKPPYIGNHQWDASPPPDLWQ